MKPKFCLPIIETAKAEVFKIIEKNNDFDFFEVWIDHVKDSDRQFIKTLINLLKDRLIIVLRRIDGKDIENNFKKRIEVIRLLNNKPCLLDLDIKNTKELNFISQNDLHISLINSFHDFKKTPSKKVIFQIISAMKKNKPKIIKIATFCRSEEDAVRLMNILQTLNKEGRKSIVLGMGKLGLVTRIFGTLWGNEMVFAPLKINKQSAPGQLTRSQLLNIFKILE